MPDYNCPSCSGGFPAPADACPWCGEAMAESDGGLQPTLSPTARRSLTDQLDDTAPDRAGLPDTQQPFRVETADMWLGRDE